jgi:hypothetical protein
MAIFNPFKGGVQEQGGPPFFKKLFFLSFLFFVTLAYSTSDVISFYSIAQFFSPFFVGCYILQNWFVGCFESSRPKKMTKKLG